MSAQAANVFSLVACGIIGAVGAYFGMRFGATRNTIGQRAGRLGAAATGWLMVLAVLAVLWYDPLPMAALGFGGRSRLGFTLVIFPIISGALFGLCARAGEVERERGRWIAVLAWLLLLPAVLALVVCLFIELAGGIGAPSLVAWRGEM